MHTANNDGFLRSGKLTKALPNPYIFTNKKNLSMISISLKCKTNLKSTGITTRLIEANLFMQKIKLEEKLCNAWNFVHT